MLPKKGPKHVKTYYDMSGKLRRTKEKIRNFFHYRLMVTSKHLLVVGNLNSEFGNQLLTNFDNWRIANVHYNTHNSCQLTHELEDT